MSEQVLVRMEPSLADAIDEWRRIQRDLPSRAEALRRLAIVALNAEKTEKPGKGRKG